eukprot:12754641-Prorocentrum_lima.AAC.1
MVRDCPEEARETEVPREETTRVEQPTPGAESPSVPSTASAVEGGTRRARSRPPVALAPARPRADEAVTAELVDLVREE